MLYYALHMASIEVSALEQDVFTPRAYQLEMLEASLQGNIIVAVWSHF